MTGQNQILMASAVLLAIPAARSALRILAARWHFHRANVLERRLPDLPAQERAAVALHVARRRSLSHDLVEFSSLVPTWALLCGLAGVALNLVARGMALGG